MVRLRKTGIFLAGAVVGAVLMTTFFMFLMMNQMDHGDGKTRLNQRQSSSFVRDPASFAEVSTLMVSGDSPGPGSSGKSDGKLDGKFWAVLYSQKGCKGETLRVDPLNAEVNCDNCFDACPHLYDNGMKTHTNIKSFQLFAENSWPQGISVSLAPLCAGAFFYPNMKYSRKGITAGNGCVDHDVVFMNFDGMPATGVMPGETPPSYHYVYSTESSTYFGMQVYANWYGFSKMLESSDPLTKIPEGTGYTRLVSMSEPDDLFDLIPSVQVPKGAYAHTYVPYNKPDAITKWFEKTDVTQDVIAVIDPDNFITGNLNKYVAHVKPGHALAQVAFFNSDPKLQELWKQVCTKNCDFVVDAAAVPYLVHREDLRKIAPLWRDWTKKLNEMFRKQPKMMSKYKSLQPSWCAEMHGYVFAAAELGIKHVLKGHIQVRDVDARLPKTAWFPKSYQPGYAWHNPEGKDFEIWGNQVWCKCNWTAAHIIPWPIPSDEEAGGKVDFQSRITLEYLHESQRLYPPLWPSKYRRGPPKSHSDYGHTFQ